MSAADVGGAEARLPDQPRAALPNAYLLLTTGLCGALVMVVEVLGSRVIGPFFGVSLFVWTALITVTLLSLAAGYALGGALADRHPSADWMYGLILGAGLFVALVPVLKPWVIPLALGLGLRAGALVSATILFGPALLLLGCVSPYVVRVAAREWAQLGRTVGVLYAVSTAGSFVGTALTGFVVIAHVGVANAFYWCGALLVLLAAVYFFCFGRRRVALLALLPFLTLLTPEAGLPTVALPRGTIAALLESRDSFYGNVKVVEYRGAAMRTRELLIDGAIQGGVDLGSGLSVYEYPYLLEQLPLAVKPDIRRALFVGLGAGVSVRGYQAMGIDTDVVDINPVVVAMAEKHFRLRLRHPAVIGDGRQILAQDGIRYDAILLDAFNGDSLAGHLLSREALASIRGRLSGDGVLAINLIASQDSRAKALPAVIRTLKSEFSQVALFPFGEPGDDLTSGNNMILLARNGPIDAALGARITGVHPLAQAGVQLAMRQGRLVEASPSALLLTDDHNPLDVLDVETQEGIRRWILSTTPPAILLHS